MYCHERKTSTAVVWTRVNTTHDTVWNDEHRSIARPSGNGEAIYNHFICVCLHHSTIHLCRSRITAAIATNCQWDPLTLQLRVTEKNIEVKKLAATIDFTSPVNLGNDSNNNNNNNKTCNSIKKRRQIIDFLCF